jgi:hypothetical protein
MILRSGREAIREKIADIAAPYSLQGQALRLPDHQACGLTENGTLGGDAE